MENLITKIRIGMLDEQITIQQVTEPPNGEYGEPVKSWATLAQVWARVEYPTTGADEDYTKATVKEYRPIAFTIRHRSDVSAKNRVVYDGEEYDIQNIEHIGRKAFTVLKCLLRK